VDVVQLVRMLDCDSGGRGFEPRHSPLKKPCGSRVFFIPSTMREYKGRWILRLVVFGIFIVLSGEHWMRTVANFVLIYYFFFTVNLFIKRFNDTNRWTKVFFNSTKTPFYTSAILIVTVFFIGRYLPQDDLIWAYVVSAIGAGVSLVGIVKRRNEGRVRNN
jgi:hypothetical protein